MHSVGPDFVSNLFCKGYKLTDKESYCSKERVNLKQLTIYN